MNRVEAENIAQKVVELLEQERVKRAWTLMVSKKNSPTLRTLLMVADVIGVDLKQIIAESEK